MARIDKGVSQSMIRKLPARKLETALSPTDPGYEEAQELQRLTGDSHGLDLPISGDSAARVLGRTVVSSIEKALQLPAPRGLKLNLFDLMGLRIFRSLPQSGFSIVTLALMVAGVMLLGHLAGFIGFWPLVIVAWAGIALALARVWRKLQWNRLLLLVPSRPEKESNSDEDTESGSE